MTTDEKKSKAKGFTPDEDKDLVEKTAESFYKGEYDSTLSLLNKLASIHGTDAKLTHNKAVTHYAKSRYKNTEDFQQVLNEVSKKCRVDVNSKQQVEDIEHCVLYYNHAVIYYNMRQYHQALQILKRMQQLVEAMDTTFVRKYLLLLMEVYAGVSKHDESLQVATKLEMIEQHGNATTTAGLPSTTVKTAVASQKLCCYLLQRNMKFYKKEMKVLANLLTPNSPLLCFMKANFEYLRGNYIKAVRILNAIEPSKTTDLCTPTLKMNNLALCFFHMKKPNLAAFNTKKAIALNAEIYVDTIGKLNPGKLNGSALPHIGMSKHPELLYNMGIQQLHCGRPQQAFLCLLEAVQVYHQNPRLWLRIAEACIMYHRQETEHKEFTHLKDGAMVTAIVGQGVHKKLILGTGIERSTEIQAGTNNMENLSYALSCLRNALYLLPSDLSSTSADAQKPLNAPPCEPLSSSEQCALRCSVLTAAAYVTLELRDYLLTLHYTEQLANLPMATPAQRYVTLLYRGEALIELDRIAEAIQQFNPSAVIDISYQPASTDQNEQQNEQDGQDPNKQNNVHYPWSPGTVQQAKAIMHHNLAVAHTIREQYEKAKANLDLCMQDIGRPWPLQVTYLKLYLELMQGHRAIVPTIINEQTGNTAALNRT